jgi:hypothetical protein
VRDVTAVRTIGRRVKFDTAGSWGLHDVDARAGEPYRAETASLPIDD